MEDQKEVLPFDAGKDSIIGFIKENQIVNERGDLISFYDRPFLYDPIRDWSRFQVYKKAAQGIGMSVTMQQKTFYAAQHKKWSLIHSFPTSDDARKFVKTKVNKMIQANPVWQDIESDNIELKGVGDRFIHYKGTGSKSGALSDTVDVIIQDEKDRSDQQFLKDLESRTINSAYKGVWSLSNPSIEGFGVDLDWAESDQKEWFVTCKKKHSHPLFFPESIDMEKKVYVCSECQTELSNDDRRAGVWTDKDGKEWDGTLNPEYKWSGYHMSLLMAPLIEASFVLEQWNEGRNEEYFNNYILGEPYSPGDTRIERHAILDNWTPKNIITDHYFLGVDIGNVKHYTLGSEKGVVAVGTFTEWHVLDKLLNDFKPVTVIDALPDNTMAHHYKDTYDNVYLSHFGRDKENNTVIRYGEKDKRGLIFSDRNRLIDMVIGELLDGKILFALPSDKSFRDFVKHCEDLRREKETNNAGIERFVWNSLTGEDHYFFSFLYYYLAKNSGGDAQIISPPKQVDRVVRTADGFRNNMQKVLERRKYERR